MAPVRTCQILILSAVLLASPAFAVRTHRAATSGHHHRHHHSVRHVIRGQRGIEPERARQILILSAVLLASPAFAVRTHRAATSGHHHRHHHSVRHVIRGQRGIEPERARQIQDALIHQGYLTGPASGEWDASTEAAMQKYQADNGWQTKLTPDSRALIKLGLGPKNDTLPPAGSATAASTVAPAAAPVSDSASNSAATETLADAHTIQN